MKEEYTLFCLATGQVMQTGRSDITLVDVPDGCAVIVGSRAGSGQIVDVVTGEFVAAPPEAPSARRAAMTISPRQLILGMHARGFISGAEAVAAATTGAMPAAVEAVVLTLPAEAQIAARVTWARMTVVLRIDPLVDLLAASQGLSAAEVDAFFAACAAL